MSCRRSDIASLKGCTIGEVGVRGCSRGCCPYPDSERDQNIRYHLKQQGAEHRDRTTPHPKGREGLYYDRCQTSYRPKFICAKKECRRGIKPFFDDERNEYRVSEWGDWEVRPLYNGDCEKSERLRRAWRNVRDLRVKRNGNAEKRMRIDELKRRLYEGGSEDLTEEEMVLLKDHDPEMWWMDVFRPSVVSGMEEVSAKRCPGCGGGVIRVGSNFRVPKRTDERGWNEVEAMIEEGVDLVARFSVCATIEAHEEMVDEALMWREKKNSLEKWEQERRRRIEVLGLKWTPRAMSILHGASE